MKRPYTCEKCGAAGLSADRGRLPRFCLDCLPVAQRRYREVYFPRFKANNPDGYKAHSRKRGPVRAA